MTEKLRLRKQDGVLIPVDAETGEEVPFEIDGDLDVSGSFRTESTSTNVVNWKQNLPGTRRGQSGLPTPVHHHNVAAQSDAPILTFVFDDGWKNNFENRQVFADNNAYICIAGVTSYIENEDGSYVNWDDLDQMYKVEGLGELLNHSRNHNYDELDDTATIDEIYDNIHGAHKDFIEHGYNPDCYVAPGSTASSDRARAVASQVYPYQHLSDGSWTDRSDPIVHNLRAHRGHDEIVRYPIDTGETIAEIEGLIDSAVTHNVGLILRGHNLIDGTIADENDSDEASTAKIEQTIQYARNQGMRMGSMSDYLAWESLPRRLPDRSYIGDEPVATSITSDTQFTHYTASREPLAEGTEHTIFDRSDPVTVSHGSISGYGYRFVYVTFYDGTEKTLYSDYRNGETETDGEGYATSSIPTIKNVVSMRVTNPSTSGGDGTIGYEVAVKE